MAKNGGYKIVDLKDKNITSTGVTIKGVHESLEATYRKAVMITGLTIDGVEKNDTFVEVNTNAGNLTIECYKGTLTITPEDLVTYTAN